MKEETSKMGEEGSQLLVNVKYLQFMLASFQSSSHPASHLFKRSEGGQKPGNEAKFMEMQ